MSKKLIIWDFDGVISDTEKLWVENRRRMLNEKFGLNWDFATANRYLGGRSDKTKKEELDRLGIVTDDAFWKEALDRDYELLEEGIELTEGIENILSNTGLRQCIATGGIKEKTLAKIKSVGIGSYFGEDKIFTADMVEHGKPEPDLFLLAAGRMGFEPKDCVVIEYSLAGMTAGLKAGMTVIAFLGFEMNQSTEYLKQVKALGIKHVSYTMEEVEKFIVEQLTKTS